MDRAAIHAAVVGATTTRPCPTRIPPCNMQRGQVPGQNTLTLGATGSYRRAPADRAVASRPDGGPTGRRRENKATRIERRSWTWKWRAEDKDRERRDSERKVAITKMKLRRSQTWNWIEEANCDEASPRFVDRSGSPRGCDSDTRPAGLVQVPLGWIGKSERGGCCGKSNHLLSQNLSSQPWTGPPLSYQIEVNCGGAYERLRRCILTLAIAAHNTGGAGPSAMLNMYYLVIKWNKW